MKTEESLLLPFLGLQAQYVYYTLVRIKFILASKNTEKHHIPNSMKRQGIMSLVHETLQLDVTTLQHSV